MLTRLQITGFKNLMDVDVRFGPFTCIAGPNGAGKSNLFDAVLFLSELADKPFAEAARSIRGGESASGLFSAWGDGRMLLAVEMLIPGLGEDEFAQPTEASANLVRYELELLLQSRSAKSGNGSIKLEREALNRLTLSESRLVFAHTNDWRDSVIRKSRRMTSYISTNTEAGTVNLHRDSGGGGRPSGFSAAALPRTLLSSAQNGRESPTAVLVRQEMRSWRLLQLEPSSMRRPDNLWEEGPMTVTGAHIPATLHRIASDADDEGRVYTETANRLAELVSGVRGIRVDRDEGRQILTLEMQDRYGLELPASVLSDGTLRFIALTVLQQDPLESGLICLEEPENGIHPERIGAMLQFLQDIVVHTETPVDKDNPLRQIIINTHSPIVAKRVDEGDLLFASLRSGRLGTQCVSKLGLACLDATWRADNGVETVPKGRVLTYLAGHSAADEEDGGAHGHRVMDRFPRMAV